MTEDKDVATIYVMGKAYRVPNTLTIMEAMEYAGYQFIRGCGCRGGFCGACTTFYRTKDNYDLHVDLACQKMVEDEMYLVQLPFIPAEKPRWDLNEMNPSTAEVIDIFPEITRCLSCNVCTKACPQELDVMDSIQAIRRGDLKEAVNLTFDCIACGACSIRCPAEITHYQVFQLARGLYGKYLAAESKHLRERLEEIGAGQFNEEMDELSEMDEDQLKDLYNRREIEK